MVKIGVPAGMPVWQQGEEERGTSETYINTPPPTCKPLKVPSHKFGGFHAWWC